MNELELSWKDKIRILMDNLSTQVQTECPLKHYFAPGVYVREIFMPAGTIVIGKIHKTEHFNIIQKGRCYLFNEDRSQELLEAPVTFVSKAGKQKVLYICEDMIWSTVHITNERNLDALEAQLIEPANYPKFDRTAERLAIEAAL
jgi:hypothetical protein